MGLLPNQTIGFMTASKACATAPKDVAVVLKTWHAQVTCCSVCSQADASNRHAVANTKYTLQPSSTLALATLYRVTAVSDQLTSACKQGTVLCCRDHADPFKVSALHRSSIGHHTTEYTGLTLWVPAQSSPEAGFTPCGQQVIWPNTACQSLKMPTHQSPASPTHMTAPLAQPGSAKSGGRARAVQPWLLLIGIRHFRLDYMQHERSFAKNMQRQNGCLESKGVFANVIILLVFHHHDCTLSRSSVLL